MAELGTLCGHRYPSVQSGISLERQQFDVDGSHGRPGIAVARHSLVEAEIASGNLVRLFDIVAPSDYSYYR